MLQKDENFQISEHQFALKYSPKSFSRNCEQFLYKKYELYKF